MPTPAGWDQDTRNQYDCALSWIGFDDAEAAWPFLWANSPDTPYLRSSVPLSERQLATTSTTGEQALDGWWYRSQSSFHLGAGLEWFNALENPQFAFRFDESSGVEVFQEGRVGLLRETEVVVSDTAEAILNTVPYVEGAGSDGGVLHAAGTSLTKVTAAGSTSSVTWGGSGTSISGLTSNGAQYFACNDTGIYRGTITGGAGSLAWQFPASSSNTNVWWLKERLFASFEVSNTAWVVELMGVGAGATINTSTPVTDQELTWSHPTQGWAWEDACSGPGGVYLIGGAGDESSVYLTSLEEDAGPPVQLLASIPEEAITLPRGEYGYSVESYVGSYILIGTTLGLRVGTIDGSGNISSGPLTFASYQDDIYDNGVRSIYCFGQYAYCSGGRATHENAAGGASDTNCLIKVDLSRELSDAYGNGSGAYAWVNCFEPPAGAGSATRTAQSICAIGVTGRIAFAVKGDGSYPEGLYFEKVSQIKDAGYLVTGKLRMETWEPKIFHYLKVLNSVVDGQLKVYWRSDRTDSYAELNDWDTDTIRSWEGEASDMKFVDWIQFKFRLIRGDTDTNTPVLTGYQTKVQPAFVAQTDIQLPLLCFYDEVDRKGLKTTRSTWDRVEAVEYAFHRGAVVRYQDFGTGEDRNVIVQDVKFVQSHVEEQRRGQSEPSGLLLVTVRTVDEG